MIATRFRVRLAVLDDVAAMHRVRCAVRENRLSDRGLITESSYRRYVAAGSIWVAVDDAGVVFGFAAIDAETASVWALFVDPAAEGAGIGRALHAAMLDWARGQGIGALRLETAPGTRAERFYRRAGWTKSEPSTPTAIWFERNLAD